MASSQIHWPHAEPSNTLGAGDVHMWALPIDDVPVPRDALWDSLADDERERAERFRFDQPRDRYVACRTSLRHLLAGYLDLRPAEIEFCYDAYGKPSLDPARHDTDLVFNVAHSGSLAVVAVATGCEVGADVECLRPVRQAEGISGRYFHPAEAADVLSGVEDQLVERFFRCWTRKEAVIKAIGTGLQFPLETFRVPVLADAPAWVDLPTGEKTTAERTWLEPCFPALGYVAAIATLDVQRSCSFHALALEQWV
jgi:4'-phosphopantetheinyl transferase